MSFCIMKLHIHFCHSNSAQDREEEKKRKETDLYMQKGTYR